MKRLICDYFDGIVSGDRRLLARAITLVESRRAEDIADAEDLLDLLREHLRKEEFISYRLGLTGVPGVGKSTFIEGLGVRLIGEGHRVAVLAVDPSSVLGGGGAILADKTRMPLLAVEADAFIRPSPSQLALGGVARRTCEVITLCEAAGFDRIIIETVGVGQSETEVSSMCDLFMLLLLPRSGDELQALKRGIMQLADIIVVNKADGDSLAEAQLTASEYKAAMRLLPSRIESWGVPVLLASALHGDGMDEVLRAIGDLHVRLLGSFEGSGRNLLEEYRRRQNLQWMWSDLQLRLMDDVRGNEAVQSYIASIEARVADGSIVPSRAVEVIMEIYRGNKKA